MEVAESAADDLKRVHLELGGKAPVVVFDDADVEAAAEAIAVAGYFNAGQDCTAATRVLAGPRRARRLRRRAHRAGQEHQDRACPTTRTSSTARSTTPTSSSGSPASSTGCPTTPRCTTGGERVGGDLAGGYFYAPTVLSGLRQDDEADPERDLRSRHHRAAVQRRGRGAALGQRRAVRAGVAASGPRTTAARCGWPKRLDFGCVWINTHIPLVAEMPHGGFKHSGYGKDLSMYGLEDYTRIKHVMISTGRLRCGSCWSAPVASARRSAPSPPGATSSRRVVVADYDGARPERAAAAVGDDRFSAAQVDASDAAQRSRRWCASTGSRT